MSESLQSHSGPAQASDDRRGGARIWVLDPLRGLAACAVTLYHFTCGGDWLTQSQGASAWLRLIGSQGWLGVHVFFVISGFVLPYAMWVGQYRLRNYGIFLLKRILRLEPPYLFALVLTVGLLVLLQYVPGFRGPPFVLDWKCFLLHFGYLNLFFGYDWYNPVFWTLAIEFQFYLLIALVFPLVVHRQLWVRVALLLGLGLLQFVQVPERFVLPYLGLFALGIVTAQRQIGLISGAAYLALVTILGAATAASLGPAQASVGLATAAIIAATRHVKLESLLVRLFNWRPLVWLGLVSYSLYLIHVPIGGRIVNFGSRYVTVFPGHLLVLGIAFCVTFLTAGLMYALVEKPSRRWSSSVTYRGRRTTPPDAESHSGPPSGRAVPGIAPKPM